MPWEGRLPRPGSLPLRKGILGDSWDWSPVVSGVTGTGRATHSVPDGAAVRQLILDLAGRPLIYSGVNMKTLGRVIPVCLAGVAILLGSAPIARAAPTGPTVVSLGDDTYSIFLEANTIFYRKMNNLKAEVLDDAAKFCASKGKQMKVLSVVEDPSIFLMGMISVKVTFKALDAGDPELLAPVPAPAGVGVTVSPAPPKDDFYAILIKLDDLHKKGILTDEEFEAEKKKILSHVN